ncbi:MAG: helix-hairpin-helix domain-containing protein [Solirubrobacterales bacterium]
MKTRLVPAHLLILIAFLFGAPASAAVAGVNAAPAPSAPMALTPEEVTALEAGARDYAPDSENASVVNDAGDFISDAGDFISDNAPYFIIGIIVLAAILAGILIMRGRRSRKASPPEAKSVKAAAGTTATKAAGAPASVPSATDIRRRKRAAMQRAREEERLRRRSGKSGGTAASSPRTASTAGVMNPVEAEKQAARAQAGTPGDVGRTGTTITPPSTGSGPTGQAVPASGAETPTAVNPQPLSEGEDVIAPGGDAAVGRAAAAFAAGAVGASAAGQTASPQPNDALEAKVAEIKSAQGSTATPVAAEGAPAVAAGPGQFVPEKPDPSQPAPPITAGLSSVERQLSADSGDRDRALRSAEQRLQEIERRAEDAERRAAFAERLAQLKLEEGERERRLDEIMGGIDRAEERAREAEERAESAERAAVMALEQGSIRRGRTDTGRAIDPDTPRPSASVPSTPASSVPVAATTSRGGLSGGINLNSATFEELREADLSVTQATRILAYRERFGGYSSIEDLERVPGFPADVVDSLRGRFTV